jgi:hypothetical protein
MDRWAAQKLVDLYKEHEAQAERVEHVKGALASRLGPPSIEVAWSGRHKRFEVPLETLIEIEAKKLATIEQAIVAAGGVVEPRKPKSCGEVAA